MEKDAIRNQKVFVSLESVLKVQSYYMELVGREDFERQKTNEKPTDIQYLRRAEARRYATENVIRTLGLPIALVSRK
jgi:hypothetical protein